MNRPNMDSAPASDGSVYTEIVSASRAPLLDRLAHFFGRSSFIVSIALGLTLGFMLLTIAGHELVGALISVGAISIAAFAARHALARKTQIEALEQRLRDETSYHAFVDEAVEGFFRTTREGGYLIVNRALARIYGYKSPEQLRTEVTDIGQSLYVDPNRRADFQRLIAETGLVKDFVSQMRQRDGTLIWISENARKVTDLDGQFLYYEGTVQDITVQRESEQATKRALMETQEAALAKAAFLAAMSHELKTPLNAVIGFSDLMRQELFGPVGEPRYRSYIVDIHDNGRRLLGMINDILDLSRIESRLLDLQDEMVNIQDAITTACKLIAEDKAEGAPVGIEIAPHLPLLKVDPRRLQQILMHLLSNAIKFTSREGHVRARAFATPQGGLAIAITDTGIGMEQDRIAHALEPFKQLDGRVARRFEGVGLGLPLANALVRLHDGALTIESAPGVGTTVTVCFPPERTIILGRAA